MAPYREDGSTLSIHRAFVVHLYAKGGPRRRRFAGRVEHLTSGRSAVFSSLRGLLAFFGPMLDGSEHTASANASPEEGLGVLHRRRRQRRNQAGKTPAKRRNP